MNPFHFTFFITNVLSDIAISSDGEWLTFIRSEDIHKSLDLYICKTDGSNEKIVFTKHQPESYGVWGISPDWSPDGKGILTTAYSRSVDDSKKTEFYLIETDIESGIEKRIKTPSFYRISQARWTFDGKSIVVLAKDTVNSPTQIWQIEYPTGKTERITNNLLEYSRLNLSQTGSFLLTNARDFTFNISLINSASGEIIEQLTHSTSLQNGSDGLTWTPDGKQIVYCQTIRGVGNLWFYDFETRKNQQITFDKNINNQRPNSILNGKFIVFLSNRSGSQQVWKIGIDGRNLEQLTTGNETETFRVSPDDKWLFYRQSGMLWRKQLDGGKITAFMKNGENLYISNDSQKVIVRYYESG